MKPLRFPGWILPALVLAAPFGRAQSPDAAAPVKKVLFFSKSSGFEHDAIKLRMKDGREGYAYPVLRQIGSAHHIEFTFSKDGRLFTPEQLAQFDGFCFYTTGDLTQAKSDPRGDGNPPMTAEGKEAFLAAIRGGKPFVGIHSATDTFHSHGTQPNTPARYEPDGADADPYIQMIGAEFIIHGAQQPSRQIVIDRSFPGMDAVPADFDPPEEWYTLKDFAPDLHVLILQDTTGMKGPPYARPPYPDTWAHHYGKGRVFYTSMGHREDMWNSPVFQAVLVGGLDWALGRVNADVTPNLATAAPQANVLEKYTPPPPKKGAAAGPISVPDWMLPGSHSHKQVPPPPDYHPQSVTFNRPIGLFEGQSDIGGPLLPGSARFDSAVNGYVIRSAGYNVFYTHDEFRYLWKRMSGDVSLAATVHFPKIGFGDRKAVFVIRQDLSDDCREVMTALHGGGLIHLARRSDKGGLVKAVYRINPPKRPAGENPLQVPPPEGERIGIEKHGDTFTLWVSLHGEPMHAVGDALSDFHLEEPFYVGIGFCSHIPDKPDTVILSDVVLENAAGQFPITPPRGG
jgi:type 1 glutamine amidotransferase